MEIYKENKNWRAYFSFFSLDARMDDDVLTWSPVYRCGDSRKKEKGSLVFDVYIFVFIFIERTGVCLRFVDCRLL